VLNVWLNALYVDHTGYVWQFAHVVPNLELNCVCCAGYLARWHDWQFVVAAVCVNEVAAHVGYLWHVEQVFGYAAGLLT
jgi:hypothetical protein